MTRCNHCALQPRLEPGRLCLACWATVLNTETHKRHHDLCACWVRDLRPITRDSIGRAMGIAESQEAR